MSIQPDAGQSGAPAIPPGCPMQSAGERFKPFEHEGMFEQFAEFRRDVPIFYAPQIDYWVVSRREDVISVLRDHERFSAVVATQPVVPWPPELLQYLADNGFTNESVQVACDPPRHTRVRSHVQGFLNPKKLQSFETEVRALVQRYVTALKGKDRVDLVDALTYELPAMTAFLLLGVKDIDPRRIKAWTELRVKLMHGFPTREEQMAAADDLLDFWNFSCGLVEQRKTDPADDYPSWLLASRGGDDEKLTENEIKSLVFALLLAAHETTSNASANIILELLRRPSVWRELVEDPSLIPNAVEEGLRYGSSVVAWRRIAKEDFELRGEKLPAGTKLLLSLASASRDHATYEDGDTFDIRRKNARTHVAFGNGIHFCMGAPIARMQIRMMLEELTAAFPNMALASDDPIEIAGVLTFRGPARLPVHLEGKSATSPVPARTSGESMSSNSISFTFVSPDGSRQDVAGPAGHTVMEVAYANGVEGVAAECGGSMSCGTCHVYLDEASYARIEAPSENEADMLDTVSSERRPTSRLSCQIKLDPALAGAEVTIPESQF